MQDESVRVGVGAVMRVPEFRALWVAEAQSLLGDQLARVALAVLAYQRTGSPAVTGLVYALTFLPAIAGGAVLSGLADRLPRRALMIWCDLIRAALLAAMAAPGMPLWLICTLLVLAVLAGRPFAASQLALLPEVLVGESYVVGSGLRMVTDQIAQLVGFASGGLIVAAIGTRPALLVDAATFLFSAAIVRAFVHHRPAATAASRAVTHHAAGDVPPDHSVRTAVQVIRGDPRLRVLLGLGCLAAFHVVPEGVAPAYAAALRGGDSAVGLLMAALPLGTAAGAWLLLRLSPARRSRLLGPLALATAVPLAACALKPGLVLSIVLWTVSGTCSAYQVQASASFVRSVPDHRRGQIIGLASSAMIAAQGIGLIGFGVIADHWGAANAIAFAGVVAFVLALPLAASWCRATGGDRKDVSVAVPDVARERQPDTEG